MGPQKPKGGALLWSLLTMPFRGIPAVPFVYFAARPTWGTQGIRFGLLRPRPHCESSHSGGPGPGLSASRVPRLFG